MRKIIGKKNKVHYVEETTRYKMVKSHKGWLVIGTSMFALGLGVLVTSQPVSADVVATSTSSSAVKAETTSASNSSAVEAETTSASSSSAVNAETTSANNSSAVNAEMTGASSSSAVNAETTSASSSLADEKEYVNNSIFAIQEEPIEYAYNEEIDSIVNKWFVKLPKDYWYGWNKTEIQNGRAIISSNDGNISTIQTHNGDQTARRSPALRQNVQVEPNKKYILNIEIEKFSGDSSYLVINDEDLSAEVNGFISGPAINNPIFNYSYSKEIVSDANGIVPVSIYMQHAEDKWRYSWAPFNITITKVSITDSTEPSTEPPVITAPNQDYKVGDSIDPLKNVTASDKEDGTTKVTVAKIVDQDGKVIDSIPNDKAGKYTVTYTTTDADGNTVTKDATISVRSNDKPVITAPNQDYKVGDSIDPLKNVTASDKEDGTTKVTVAKIVDQDGKVIDSIPNDKAGKYTVTYTTTDADGNTVTKDATISVRSNEKPGNGTDNGNPSSNQPGNPSQPSNATNNGVINTSTNIGSKVNNGAVNSPELPQTGENNRQSQTMSFIGVLLAMFGSLLGFLGIKKRRND